MSYLSNQTYNHGHGHGHGHGDPQASNQPSIDSGNHNLSLKVMRISAPSLSTFDRPYFESNSNSTSNQPSTSNLLLTSLPTAPTATATSIASLDPSSSSLQAQAQSIQLAKTDDKLTQAREALHQASRSETLANDKFRAGSGSGNGGSGKAEMGSSISTGRDWNISDTLVLPSSFGTIFLGETFSVYLCLNNESSSDVANANLRIEMQVGDTVAQAQAQPNQQQPRPNQPIKTLIGSISSSSSSIRASGSSSQGLTEARPENDLNLSLLSPSSKLETTVKHEMKELGPHVLVCSVSYLARVVDQSGQEQWVERDFRKYYKFSVPTSPLAVRTRATSQRSPNALLSPQASLRDRIFLDVSMQNVGGRPLVLEGVNLLAEDGWCWRSVDRPKIGSKEQPEGEEILSSNMNKSDLWNGTSEYLLPDDTRQLLFIMYFLSKDPVKPIPPLPLGLGGINSQTNQPSQHQFGNPSKPSLPRIPTTQQAATPLATISIPLGKLDIAWRTGMGEVGRLQTSTLNRRKPFIPPVACQSDSNSSNEVSQFGQSIRRNPSPSQPFRAQRQPSNLGPSTTPLQAPPPLPKDSPAASNLPPPLLEADLALIETPEEFECSIEKPFDLGFQVWIRDLSLLNQNSTFGPSRRPSATNSVRRASTSDTVVSNGTAATESSDDSDDDRPLSEIASPRMSLRGLDSRTNSPDRRFSTASNSSNAATNPYFLGSALSSISNGVNNRKRKLFVAAQFLSNHPDLKSSSDPSTQDARPELSLVTSPTSLGPGLSRASTIGGGRINTPLRDHRDPKPLSRSSTSDREAPRGNGSNSPAPYAIRSSTDSSRTKSPPTALPTSYQVRQPSNSRPSTPTQSLTTQMEGLRSQATSPNPIPPPPPPKNSFSLGLGPSHLISQPQVNSNPLTDVSNQILPPPFFDPTKAANVAPTGSVLPSEHIVHLGTSLIKLDPVLLSSQAEGKAGGLGIGEGKVEFKSSYLPIGKGMAKLGGLRIMLLGWKDMISGSAEEDSIEKFQEEKGVEWLRQPIVLREWETLAEMWVG